MAEHDGHRQRLIEKLTEGTLCDHEYLEVLLFNALPRKNTNDIAHRLLSQFGSLSGVLNASMEQLKKVDGVGKNLAAHIYCTGLCVRYYQNEKIVALPKKFTHDAFLTFAKKQYANVTKEVLDMYFIDSEGAVYKKASYTTQSLYHVIVQPEELTAMFLKERTSGVVLVHTHVSGEMSPSAMDDKTTEKICKLCMENNVMLCDHVVCSSRGMYSYYKSGKLWDIQNTVAFSAVSGSPGKEDFV